jgi:hypothetical protein
MYNPNLMPKGPTAVAEAHLAMDWSRERIADEMDLSVLFVELVVIHRDAIHYGDHELVATSATAIAAELRRLRRRPRRAPRRADADLADPLPVVSAGAGDVGLGDALLESLDDAGDEGGSACFGAFEVGPVGVGKRFEVVHGGDDSTGQCPMARPRPLTCPRAGHTVMA